MQYHRPVPLCHRVGYCGLASVFMPITIRHKTCACSAGGGGVVTHGTIKMGGGCTLHMAPLRWGGGGGGRLMFCLHMKHKMLFLDVQSCEVV